MSTHVAFATNDEGSSSSSSSTLSTSISTGSESGFSPRGDDDDDKDTRKSRRTSWSRPVSKSAKLFKKKASKMIIQVPVSKLTNKFTQAERLTSLQRETQHFVGITGLHGVLRIYRSKGWKSFLWVIITILCGCLLIWQTVVQLQIFFNQPTVSQVSFLLSDQGMYFPKITICNFNPIRKSYIDNMNQTGDFSIRLLNYLMQANDDVLAIYGMADLATLKKEDQELTEYMKRHPQFDINKFYFDAGFSCSQVIKMCSFAGRQFDCCNFTTPVLTSLGRCHVFNLRDSPFEWMRKQKEEGVDSGLQLILDAHLEEQFDTLGPDPDPVFSNQFENGFRFYVNEPETSTTTSSQGISVSPGDRIYSAISTIQYSLLNRYNWGNCTNEWPEKYKGNNTSRYSTRDCLSKCKARFFNEQCRCSPFAYNIDGEHKSCTPLETYNCTQQIIVKHPNDTKEEFVWPDCSECIVECNRLEYSTSNSYGNGFSAGALRWLNHHNNEWTTPHIRANFLTINVFFRDMAYTEYQQVQATNFSQILSNLGGNMGMFLGLSVLTCIEIGIYIFKVIWIAFSSKRSEYMLSKKRREEAEAQKHEETMKSLREMSAKNVDGIAGIAGMFSGMAVPHAQAPVHEDGSSEPPSHKASISGRFKRWTSSFRMKHRVMPSDIIENDDDDEPRRRGISLISRLSSSAHVEQKDKFMERFYDRVLRGTGRASSISSQTDSSSEGSVIELKIDLNELKEQGHDVPTVTATRKHGSNHHSLSPHRHNHTRHNHHHSKVRRARSNADDFSQGRKRFSSVPPEFGHGVQVEENPPTQRPRLVSFYMESPSVSQTNDEVQRRPSINLQPVLDDYLGSSIP